MLAIGLGDIVVRSVIDAPISAEINLVSIYPGELDTLRVSLSSDSDFRKAGIERAEILDELTFALSTRTDGSAIVEVSSKKIVSDPYLHFLLTLEWTGGRIVREYEILLELPIYSDSPSARIISPRIPRGLSLPTEKDLQDRFSKTEIGLAFGPVKRGDDLISIANAVDVPNNISLYQRLYAILDKNPHGFLLGNMNLLRTGVVLDIPHASHLAAVSRVLATQTFRRHVEEWQEYKEKLKGEDASATVNVAEGPSISSLQESINILEAEINRLNALLEEMIDGAESSKVLDRRDSLLGEVEQLQSAKDALLQGLSDREIENAQLDRSSIPKYVLKIVQPPGEEQVLASSATEPDNAGMVDEAREQLPQAKQDNFPDNEKMVLMGRKVTSLEERLMSRTLENKELRGQIALLESQIQKSIALLRIQDENLALAQQESAVYSAALEAKKLENLSTATAELNNIDNSSTIGNLISNDIGSVTNQPVESDSMDMNQTFVERVVGLIDNESNNSLLLFIAIVLFTVLILLILFKKSLRSKPGLQINGISKPSPGMQKEKEILARQHDKAEEESPPQNVSTQLDLARAYVEMGEGTVARKMLMIIENSETATVEQKGEARILLQSIES